MARARSPQKRVAILQATIDEIADVGLVAATAKIAKRAGVASGTLFTYFESKEQLFNELYLALKGELYARVDLGFPAQASLKERTKHLWISNIQWGLASKKKRKVAMQLNVSDILTPETRAKVSEGFRISNATLAELSKREEAEGLPTGFAAATMSAILDATIELIAKHPQKRDKLVERGFEIVWQAVR